MLLRPGGVDDLPRIAELYLSVRRHAFGAMPALVHTPDEVRAWISCWDLSQLQVWVAELDDGLVGFVAFTPTWLDHLYVAPAAQGSGVGSALLGVVKATLVEGFSLWVFQSNLAARGFYASHGLVERERTDGSDNEEGEPDLRMQWQGVAELSVP